MWGVRLNWVKDGESGHFPNRPAFGKAKEDGISKDISASWRERLM